MMRLEHNSEQNSVVQQDDGSGKHFVLEDFDGPLDVLLFLIKTVDTILFNDRLVSEKITCCQG